MADPIDPMVTPSTILTDLPIEPVLPALRAALERHGLLEIFDDFRFEVFCPDIRIFVNDTGIGLSGEELAKVGRPFVQVHNDYTRQFQGTGLGLSLVKGLVELHKGTMTIESAPGLPGAPVHRSPALSAGDLIGGGRMYF
jgi:signal transduction histidine kinase